MTTPDPLTPVNWDGLAVFDCGPDRGLLVALDQDDIEILKSDREALAELITAILTNKRLAWMIVQAWLRQHSKVIITRDEWTLIPKEKQP